MDTPAAKRIYRQRGEVAEFPKAWIKNKIGLRKYHERGLAKAATEPVWACLTYNVQLWIRLPSSGCYMATQLLQRVPVDFFHSF
jgi:hypothetical protein